MKARKDLSDGIFHDNILGKGKMNPLTTYNENFSPLLFLRNPNVSIRIHAVRCLYPLSFVSDVLTKLKGHCQPGQKQLGSECVCMSPEEDCR